MAVKLQHHILHYIIPFLLQYNFIFHSYYLEFRILFFREKFIEKILLNYIRIYIFFVKSLESKFSNGLNKLKKLKFSLITWDIPSFFS